ncbi:hypothetical protein [Pseudomonas sp.]|uniref:hypothetical protein n=1 Tax=Pseudomonas sp. TaxID=306 RepID=UPI002ED8E7CF
MARQEDDFDHISTKSPRHQPRRSSGESTNNLSTAQPTAIVGKRWWCPGKKSKKSMTYEKYSIRNALD